jgi:hypothetical protein
MTSAACSVLTAEINLTGAVDEALTIPFLEKNRNDCGCIDYHLSGGQAMLVKADNVFRAPRIVIRQCRASVTNGAKFVPQAHGGTAARFPAQLLSQRLDDRLGDRLAGDLGQSARKLVCLRMFDTEGHIWILPEYPPSSRS